MKRIVLLLAAAAVASSASAQTLKDRNTNKIKHSSSAPEAKKFSAKLSSSHIHEPAVISRPAGASSADKQLSAMQQRTQKIVGTHAAAKKTAAVYVQPKQEPSSGGFNATPYRQKRKSTTVTNSSQGRGAVRN